MKERSDRTAKKLLVAVTTELTGEGAGLVAKGKEGGLNVLVLKRFKTERPVVACGSVDKNERKFEPTVFRAGNDVLIVAEAATTGESMEFLRGVCPLGLQRIRCVAGSDGREAGVGVVEGGNNLFIGHAFQFSGGAVLCPDTVAVVRMLQGIETLNELIPRKVLKADGIGRRGDEGHVERRSGGSWGLLRPVGDVGGQDFGQDIIGVVYNNCRGRRHCGGSG
jgi:hypothetical protein